MAPSLRQKSVNITGFLVLGLIVVLLAGLVVAQVVSDNGAPVSNVMDDTDADTTGESITYSLTSNPGGLFEIDANSGEVTLASGQSLDCRYPQITRNLCTRIPESLHCKPRMRLGRSFSILCPCIID